MQSGVQTLNVGIASDAVGHAQLFAQRFFSSISKKTFPVVVGVRQHGNEAISGGAGLSAARQDPAVASVLGGWIACQAAHVFYQCKCHHGF